jgi:hypothetical protein
LLKEAKLFLFVLNGSTYNIGSNPPIT